MRKRRIVVVVAAAIVAALALRPLLFQRKEPTSKGKPLSYWVLREDHQYELSEQKAEADAAIQQTGTNALPLLLEWIQHKQPPWRRTLWKLSLKLPSWWIADRIKETRTDILARNSVEALQVLGPQAAPIIPTLICLLTNHPASDTVFRVNDALASMGTNALPALMSALEDPVRAEQRGYIFAAIRNIRPPSEMAAPFVPVLIRCLADTNFPEIAALTLGSLGVEPQTVVPALIHSLDSSNALVRLFTAKSLTNFPSQAAIILPGLTNRLNDNSPAVRTAASNSINTILAQRPEKPHH